MNTTTIEVKSKKSEMTKLLTFVKFTIEVLDSSYVNLTVANEDCDNLTDILDKRKIEWRLV